MTEAWEDEGGAAIAHAFTGLAREFPTVPCDGTCDTPADQPHSHHLVTARGSDDRASSDGEQFTWLEILASRKRQSVASMREIMEPVIDDLVREVLVQYTGWLVHEGYLSGPYDAALVVAFLREVHDAGSAGALDSGGPDDGGLPAGAAPQAVRAGRAAGVPSAAGSALPPSSAGLGVISTRALVRELVQRGLARRLADQAGGVALHEWATQMQKTLPAEVLEEVGDAVGADRPRSGAAGYGL